MLAIAGACSAPDRDYRDLGSSGSSGSSGGGGKLSVISGGRAGGPNAAGAGGEGGMEPAEGGAPASSGAPGTGGVLGSGGMFAAGAAGAPEPAGAGGELNPGSGGRSEPGAGGATSAGGKTGAGGNISGGGITGTGGLDTTSGGRITIDPCATVLCNTPPAVTCVDAATVRTFGAGTCNAGRCDYPPTDTKCPANQACANGACSVCAVDTQCGPSCSPCASSAPRCKAAGTGSSCVQCLTSRDCGGNPCDPMTNRCVKGQALLLTNQTSILKFDALTGTSLGVFASGGDLRLAYDLAIGPNGHLYVADYSGNAIREYDGATGAYIASPVSTKAPYNVAFGPDGNMYVGISGGTVYRYSAAGAAIGTFVQGPSGADMGGIRFFGTDLFVSYIGTAGSLVRYDAKGSKVADIYTAFSGNGPRAPSFGPDGTLFVPEWQTPYVKVFAPGSYKYGGNIITDRELSANSIGFAADGAMLVLSDNGNLSSVRRYDPATGTFLGVLVAPGSGGLGRSTRMLVLPPN
ncbi:MAG TPA: hypothetical protein VFQ35_09060 [Polyangiaceae bacterium]|nr:hypothetical protein [Polyangiaceae bacterium]